MVCTGHVLCIYLKHDSVKSHGIGCLLNRAKLKRKTQDHNTTAVINRPTEHIHTHREREENVVFTWN